MASNTIVRSSESAELVKDGDSSRRQNTSDNLRSSVHDEAISSVYRHELRAIVRASIAIIIAAIVFIFIQLAADIYLALRDVETRNYGVSSGAYTIGLVMLMIGAGLVVTVFLASRARASVDSSDPASSQLAAQTPGEEGPAPNSSLEAPSLVSQSELYVKLRTAPSSPTSDGTNSTRETDVRLPLTSPPAAVPSE